MAKEQIRSSLQIDLDLSKVQDKVRDVNRQEDKADKRAEELKEKAKQITEGLEAQEARIERGVHKFEHKVVMHPLKHLGKASIGLLASEIGAGFEGGGDTSWLKKIGSAALFGLAGGPEGSVIAALGVSVELLFESIRESSREAGEIRKKMIEAEDRHRKQIEDLEEKIEGMRMEIRLKAISDEIKVRQIAGELDQNTFLLMGAAED